MRLERSDVEVNIVDQGWRIQRREGLPVIYHMVAAHSAVAINI